VIRSPKLSNGKSKMNIKERKQCNPIEHVILPSSVVSVFDVLLVGHVCGPQDVGKFCTRKKGQECFSFATRKFQLNKSLFPRILLKNTLHELF